MALYPPQIGTEQSLYTVGSEEWRKSKVIGYKDSRGNDAEVGALVRAFCLPRVRDKRLQILIHTRISGQPGTYDELTSIVRPL